MGKEKVRQPNKKAKVLKSEIIYEGKTFGVRRDELIEPTGVHTIREVVTHPGSVVILPVLTDGRIVLVRQYRHAARQYLWELVAGRMEPGENPKKGAQRELLEERMFLLLAEGLSAGEAQPEEDEKIIMASYTRTQLEEMMRTRKLRDAKSIAGLLFYFSLLAKRSSAAKK